MIVNLWSRESNLILMVSLWGFSWRLGININNFNRKRAPLEGAMSRYVGIFEIQIKRMVSFCY